VNKDAKYTVRRGPNDWAIHLVFRLNSREQALLSHDGHEALVKMVNAVKEAVSGTAGGAFYINEFSDVVVPAGNEPYYAGTYDEVLEFDLNGQTISADAGSSLKPGDEWSGPHVGTAYTLSAGANDIKYSTITGRISREIRLSDFVGEQAARALAQRLATVKGNEGGRIYINERCHFFAPVGQQYLYLGSLDDSPWFPPPDVPGRD